MRGAMQLDIFYDAKPCPCYERRNSTSIHVVVVWFFTDHRDIYLDCLNDPSDTYTARQASQLSLIGTFNSIWYPI